jgi:hypothetical protein
MHYRETNLFSLKSEASTFWRGPFFYLPYFLSWILSTCYAKYTVRIFGTYSPKKTITLPKSICVRTIVELMHCLLAFLPSMNHFDTLLFGSYLRKGEKIVYICHRHIMSIIDDVCLWMLFGVFFPSFFYSYNSFGLQGWLPSEWLVVYLIVVYA